MADKGLVTVESRFGVRETIDRLAEAVRQAGLTVFARIDHAAGAYNIGASRGQPSFLSLAIRKAARH